MFRTLLLVSIVPLVVACQNAQQPATPPTEPGVTLEDEVSSPTAGLNNEIGVNN